MFGAKNRVQRLDEREVHDELRDVDWLLGACLSKHIWERRQAITVLNRCAEHFHRYYFKLTDVIDSPIVELAKARRYRDLRVLIGSMTSEYRDYMLQCLFVQAAYRCDEPVLRSLYATGAVKLNGGGDNLTALQAATWAGHLDVVHELVTTRGIDVNLLSSDEKESALTIAIKRDNVKCLERLLKAGAQPNQFVSGRSALYAAVSQKRLRCLKLLLEYGADPDQIQAFSRTTPLRVARAMGDVQIVELLQDYAAPECGGLSPIAE